MRKPRKLNLMRGVIHDVEQLTFPHDEKVRAGFADRHVREPLRYGGHISGLDDLCHWVNAEFGRGFDEGRLCRVIRNHDRAKFKGDQSRLSSVTWGKDPSRIRRWAKRIAFAGLSRRDRERELVTDLEIVEPLISSVTVRVRDDIVPSMVLYYRRPWKSPKLRRMGIFVHDMGKVMDVHRLLVYIDSGRVDAEQITRQDIQSLIDGMSQRLEDWTAKLYWEVVLEKYRSIILQFIPTGELVAIL